MMLYEYEAKAILQKYGINVPLNVPMKSIGELDVAFANFNRPVVLKPVGMKKRGKAGLIRFADNLTDAKRNAVELFGVNGVKELIMEEKLSVQKELYFGITIDYSAQKPVFILTAEGGVDIEDVSKNTPDLIKKVYINILSGPDVDKLRVALATFGLKSEIVTELERYAMQLYKLFVDYDADTLEINPLAITETGKLVALDCLLTVSDDALFRHQELELLKDRNYSTEREKLAGHLGWSYLDMDGNIGILSSGAGLTLTILDLMEQYGGKPANFLDTAQMGTDEIYKAFDLISGNENVKVIFVNIFAGLNRCDLLAEGIKKYVTEKKPSVPIVVRMIGNKEEEGWDILRGIGIEPIKELELGVRRAVDVANGLS